MNMTRNAKADAGFTLIELLVTVAILGILAAIALPIYMSYTRTAERTAVEVENRQEMIDREWNDMMEDTDGTAPVAPVVEPTTPVVNNPAPVVTGEEKCLNDGGRVTGPDNKRKCHMPGNIADYYIN